MCIVSLLLNVSLHDVNAKLLVFNFMKSFVYFESHSKEAPPSKRLSSFFWNLEQTKNYPGSFLVKYQKQRDSDKNYWLL